jgi:hypothetical protein
VRPRRSPRDPSAQSLLALFAAGMVLFNFPLLSVFDRDATVFGLPLLPVALFAVWAILIGLLAWAIRRRVPDPSGGEDRSPLAAPGQERPNPTRGGAVGR